MLAAVPLALMAEAGGGVDAEAARLERKAESYRHLYHGAGDPGDLLILARDYLESTMELLRRLPDGSLRRRVLRNRSEVGTLAGRLAFFDLHDVNQARGYYGLAQEAAVEAADDALAAAALGHLAFVPAREGNVSAAIDYLGSALSHARRTGVPAVRSWIAGRPCGSTTTPPAGWTASAATPCSRSAELTRRERSSTPRWPASHPPRAKP
jgi:hypothetical protein